MIHSLCLGVNQIHMHAELNVNMIKVIAQVQNIGWQREYDNKGFALVSAGTMVKYVVRIVYTSIVILYTPGPNTASVLLFTVQSDHN